MLQLVNRLKEGTHQPAEAALEGVAYVDGAFLPANEAAVPLLDWGVTRSDAFQETVSFWGGYSFALRIISKNSVGLLRVSGCSRRRKTT